MGVVACADLTLKGETVLPVHCLVVRPRLPRDPRAAALLADARRLSGQPDHVSHNTGFRVVGEV